MFRKPSKSRLRRMGFRRFIIEQFEPRLLLNSDWQNPARPTDVNNDLTISPLDALLVIDKLNSRTTSDLPARTNPLGNYYDTNGDSIFSPIDALFIIDDLNHRPATSRTVQRVDGEAEVGPAGFISVPLTTLPGRSGQIVSIATNLNIGREEFNEMGLFVVDSPDGSVNGILPSSPNYGAAVFQSSQRQVLYSQADILRTARTAVFPAGALLRTYVLQSSTTNGDPGAHLRARETGTNQMRIGWEEVASIADWQQVGDRGYDDAIVDVQIGTPFDGNAEPVITAIPNQSISEETPLLIQPIVMDADLPNDALVFTLDIAPAGATIDRTTGTVRWNPTESQGPGNFEFILRATDRNGAFDTESFFVTVLEVNRPPALEAIGDIQVTAGQTVAFAASATDPDLPANEMIYSLRPGSPSGATIDRVTGQFSWSVPTSTAVGQYPVTVRVTDSGTPSLSDDVTFTIVVVRPVNDNDPPVIADISNQFVSELTTFAIQPIVTDPDLPDDDSLTFTLDLAPSGAAIDPKTGRISWMPSESQGPGTYEVILRATDRAGAFDTEAFTLTVLEANLAPVLPTIADKSIAELSELEFTITATDGDLPNNGLTYSIASAPSGASIDSQTGVFSWTPTESQGPGSFTVQVRVDDGQGGTDTEEFSIAVSEINQPPVLNTIANQSVASTQAMVVATSATDTDLPANTLSFSLGAGAPAGASIDAVTGRFAWTPDSSFSGRVVPVTVIVTDNGTPSLSSSQTFDIAVDSCAFDSTLTGWTVFQSGGTALGKGSVTAQSCAAVMIEGDSFVVGLERSIVVPATPSAVRFTFSAPQFAESDSAFINDAFELSVVDTNGKTLVFPYAANRDTFFNVTEGLTAITAPGVLVSGSTVTVDLSSIAAGTAAKVVLRLINNDSDTTSQVVVSNVELIASNQPAPLGATSNSSLADRSSLIDTSLLTDISGSFVGEYSRTSFNEDFDVLDVEIGIRNAGQFATRVPLYVGVKNISDPTVRVSNAVTLTTDGIPLFDFTTLVPSGQLLPSGVTGITHLQFFNPQRIQFNYELVFYGQLNRSPAITSEPNTEAIINRVYRYNVTAIDPDADPIAFSLVTAPTGMTINAASGALTWTPGTGDVGTTSITVRVEDDRGGFAEQRYTLNVITTPPNRPPVFTSVPVVTTNVNAPYTYDADAVDPDGHMLTYSVVISPSGLQINDSTGQVTWTPLASQVGSQNLTIRVDDGNGGTATQSFTVIVGQASGNRSPVIVSEPVTSAIPGVTYSYDVDAVDPDNDHLNYSLVNNPPGMTIDPRSGLINWNAVTLKKTFTPISLGSAATSQLSTIDPTFPTGDLVFSGVPFVIPGTGNNVVWNNDGPSSGTIVKEFPVGVVGVTQVQSLLNTTFGQPGPNSYLKFEFYGSAGDVYTKEFIGNSDVRDLVNNTWTNSINGTSTTNVHITGLKYRMDKQTIELPSSFANQSLTKIRMVDNGAFNFQRAVLYGITVLSNVPTTETVSLRVDDEHGGFDTQSFTIDILGNRPPKIVSDPITDAYVGTKYSYDVDALDADGDQLVYTLANSPKSMTIDSSTGVIAWDVPSDTPNFEFAHSFGSNGRDDGRDVATDSEGNIYLTGFVSSPVDLDPGPGVANVVPTGTQSAFVAKYSPNGNFLWVRSPGGSGSSSSNAIVIDRNDNVYLAGNFKGTVDFDPGTDQFPLTSSTNGASFVWKLDTSGNFVWVRATEGNPDEVSGEGLTVDDDGNVILLTNFYGTIDADPGTNVLPFSGVNRVSSDGVGYKTDILLVKLSSEGTLQWARHFGDARGFVESSRRSSITTNSQGEVLLTGRFQFMMDFDPGPAVQVRSSINSSEDIFALKLTSAGDLAWVRTFDGTAADRGFGIDTDDSGNIAITGIFAGTLDLDPDAGVAQVTASNPNAANLGYNAPLILLDTDGQFRWGSKVEGFAYAVTFDDVGNLYTNGSFGGLIDFDPGQTEFKLDGGETRWYTSKYSNSGDFMWAHASGGYAITVDCHGYVVSTGYYSGKFDFDPTGGVREFTSSGGSLDAFLTKTTMAPTCADVTVRVDDGRGGFDTQSFEIEVGGNRPPEIVSTPITDAFAGTAYSYDVDAIDLDNDTLTYSLTSKPNGMTIDPATGVVSWLPTTESQFGYAVSVENSFGLAVAADVAGNVVATGGKEGDIFVAKHDAQGVQLWSNRIVGPATNDGGQDVAVDASGNVYVTGHFRGTFDFDSGPGVFELSSNGFEQAFVLKLDPTGKFLWATVLENQQILGHSDGEGIALDNFGNVYVSGDDANGAMGFIAKLDNSGALLWQKRVATNSLSSMAAVRVDEQGFVVGAGSFGGTTDFDPGSGVANLTSAGSIDSVVWKLDSDGNFVWAKRIGGNAADALYDLEIDRGGNVVLAGLFNGTVDFDPGPSQATLTANTQNSSFVLKLDSNGDFEWAGLTGGATANNVFYFTPNLAVDQQDNVYLSGDFNGIVDTDPGAGVHTVTSHGDSDVFITKLDPTGSFIWTATFGGTKQEVGYDIAVDAFGRIYSTGLFNESVDFDPGAGVFTLSTSGSANSLFVMQLTPSVSIGVRVEDGRGGFDTQSFTIDVRPSSNVDLQVSEVDPDALVFDGQQLTVSGTIAATIKNQGSQSVLDPFEVLFFEDRNDNSNYDLGVDNVLGMASVTSPLASNGTTNLTATLAGSVLFSGNRVWAFVDSGSKIRETDETNNLGVHRCEYTPQGGQPTLAPDLIASFVRANQSGPNVTYTARIGNGGSANAPAGINIAYYDGDPRRGGELKGVVQTSKQIKTGQYEDVALTVAGALFADVWVVADDGFNHEGEFEFSTLDVPGAQGTAPLGINSRGQVVGQANFSAPLRGAAFLWDHGTFSLYRIPDARNYTAAMSLNDEGQIVGLWDGGNAFSTDIAFESTTPILVPGADVGSITVYDINEAGEIVGNYSVQNLRHGYARSAAGNYTTIDYPGAVHSWAYGNNNFGEVVGEWRNDNTGTTPGSHAWIRDAAGQFTSFDAPLSVGTVAIDINDAGQVVGWFQDAGGRQHGFLRNADGIFTTIDVPGSVLTNIRGISNTGQITGYWNDAAGLLRGFVGTPIGQVRECDEANNLYHFVVPGTAEIRGTKFNDLNGDGKRTISNASDLSDVWKRESPDVIGAARYPEITRLSDGRLRMYYSGDLTAVEGAIFSASSSDGGVTWQSEGMRLLGNPGPNERTIASEPAVIQLSNGSYRMYYTAQNASDLRWDIYSAISPDGLSWTKEAGVRIPRTFGGIHVGSPEIVALSNGTFRLYFSGSDDFGTTAGKILSATSNDGLTWNQEAGVRLGADNQGYLFQPNIITLSDGRLRMYTTGNGIDDPWWEIYSAVSIDGVNWSKEPGIRVDGQGNESIAGSALVPVSCDAYLMFFSVRNMFDAVSHVASAVNFGEPALSPWTIYLDQNQNGKRDTGERYTVTDASGNFSFPNLPPGSYVVAEELRSGWMQTAPVSQTHLVTVAMGQVAACIDFGNRTTTESPPNRTPQFVSTAPNAASSGALLRYNALAIDPDNDPLSYDLVVKPTGMAVQSNAGIIVWVPSTDQVGTHDVTLRVSDGRGGVALQSFVIIVAMANSTPVITSRPKGPAVVGLPYEYRVTAQDADGDGIVFSLGEHPAGMTIDANSGVVSWTPAANQVGSPHVDVIASDNRGASTTQSFDLPTVATAPNRTPNISSIPRGSIRLGSQYWYAVIADDPDGDPLVYSLPQSPTGMTIDPKTGLVTWTPSGNQMGAHDVQVKVDDGRGASVTQSFTVTVVNQSNNRPPNITSTPPAVAVVGRAFTYDVVAIDPDGDPLAYSLDESPNGMSVSAIAGTIRWTPTADQLGARSVVVRVIDGQGGFATQSFTINVRAVNTPPNVTSTPPTFASIGNAYSYAVRATDIDGDVLTFAAITLPTGMTIDSQSGLIRWTPAANQLGSHEVAFRVDDGQGGAATQIYSLVVTATASNNPPVITSNPNFVATVDSLYQYNVTATDADGDTLTYQLQNRPAGMLINSTTGVVTWTPTAGQLGTHTITVAAVDGQAGGTQTFTLRVATVNRAPTITSQPPPGVVAGLIYRYDVKASDPDGDPLTYTLESAPPGMTIDNLGRITWQTTKANVGTHRIAVSVEDDRGLVLTQTFDIAIIADGKTPLVNLIVSPGNTIAINSLVTFVVTATDNVGVKSIGLKINGTPVPLDAAGRVSFIATPVGLYDIVASATDDAGNTGLASTQILVFDNSDQVPPIVQVTSPLDNAIVSAPIDVVGTVTDASLAFYTLSVAPVGSDAFTEIVRRTTSVTAGVLGKFDPTGFANDSYILRLEATDTGDNVSFVDTLVQVAGDLKIGNFTLSFTDMTVPVSGIPITVSRTYDTLQANQQDDFGFGWRLEFRDTNLRTSVPSSGAEEYGSFTPYNDGARVYVTAPGGRREGFTFRPRLVSGFGALIGVYNPAFVPDRGVTSQLAVDNFTLIRSQSDGLFYGANGLAYNPTDELNFGGRFYLTTKDGIAYEIDANNGDLISLSDANRNVLTFTEAAIESNRGPRITFQRDPQGRITGVTDPSGHRVQYKYDSKGDLISVTDREGNVTQFVYSEPRRPHFLTAIIDPLGRTGVRTEYDAQGRLIRLMDAAGNPVQLVHDPDNFIETVTDALGNSTSFEYDLGGNVITEVDAAGGITRRTYDSANNMLTEKDPLGNITTFTYDGDGNLLTERDPLGNVTRNTYTTTVPGFFDRIRGARSVSLLTTTTDPLGNTTTNSYSGTNLVSTRDAAGNITRFAYDSVGNQTSITDAAGNVTTFEYDTRGNLTRQVDGLGNTTVFTYDSNGNQLTQSTRLTTPSTVRTLVTSTQYDPSGHPLSVTDAEGHTSRTEYNQLGQQTATVDSFGRRTAFTYDVRGQLMGTTFADGTTTSTAYDALGRRISSTDRAGRVTKFVFDALGRLTTTIYPDTTPVSDTDNPRTRTEYDLAGRVTAQIDELGHRTEFVYDAAGRQTVVRNALGLETSTSYDTAGRTVAATDALGHKTQFVYDTLGSQIRTQFADGTTTSTAYDALGRSVAQTDQAGRVTMYEYDSPGRLTAVVDALGQRTQYTYDEAGNLLSQRDANGNVTRYEYDGLGRRTAHVLPLGQRSTTVYDAVGNVTRTTDFNGDAIVFGYDILNRLTSKSFPDSTSVQFTYNVTGQRETYIDARGTTRWAYDVRDRLISRTDPDGRIISYTYDAAGNRTSLTVPSGTTNYTFDELNRTSTVSDPQGGVTRYTYDSGSRLIRTDQPNGTFETRQYDVANHLLFLENRNPTGVISSYRYTLDPTGNRTAVVEDTGRRVDYFYDDLYRLTRESIQDSLAGNRNITYTYDPVGNRLLRTDSVEGDTSYTYDENDRLRTETLAGKVTTYTYDNNGNTLSKADAVDQVFYDWDYENRLITADTNGDGTNDVTYRYDGEGIRVGSTVGSEETRFLIDSVQPYQQVIEEYTAGGVIKVSYVHGLDLISQNRAGEGKTFYHVDGLGSTRALSSALGVVTDRYAYEAFGRTIGQVGSTGNVYLFAGEQRDEAVGLDYLRARYNDFRSGRFVNRDYVEGDIQRPLSRNSYLYVEGSPVIFADPTGFSKLLELVATVPSIGILSSSIGSNAASLFRGIGAVGRTTAGSQVQLGSLASKMIFSLGFNSVLAGLLTNADSNTDGLPVILFGTDVGEARQHILDAESGLGSGIGGNPIFVDGLLTRRIPLGYDEEAEGRWIPGSASLVSRNCGAFRSVRGVDCDEFPFYSTNENSRTLFEYGFVSLREIDRSDNRRAGSKLGLFYRKFNLTAGKPFYAGTTIYPFTVGFNIKNRFEITPL